MAFTFWCDIFKERLKKRSIIMSKVIKLITPIWLGLFVANGFCSIIPPLTSHPCKLGKSCKLIPNDQAVFGNISSSDTIKCTTTSTLVVISGGDNLRLMNNHINFASLSDTQQKTFTFECYKKPSSCIGSHKATDIPGNVGKTITCTKVRWYISFRAHFSDLCFI